MTICKPYSESHVLEKEPSSKAASLVAPQFTAKHLASIYGFPVPDICNNVVVGVITFGGSLYGTIDKNGILTNGDVQKYLSYQGYTANQMPKVIVYSPYSLYDSLDKPDLTDSDSTIDNTTSVSIIASCCPSPRLTIILFVFPRITPWDNCFRETTLGATIAGVKYIPSIISVSWGGPEISYFTNGKDTSGELSRVNDLLEAATQNGINICVAAGDNGSTANNGSYKLSVNFPASSPYVTAVGGTSLLCPNGVYDSRTIENVWNNGISSGKLLATGGGVSGYFEKPEYQLNVAGTGLRRSVPDIALNADPNTGVRLYINGALNNVGGTSVSVAMFAGYLACVNAKKFVNPILYKLENASTCFRDISNGYNYAINDKNSIQSYSAKIGYDFCTGLGSIIGEELTNVLVTRPVFATSISIIPNKTINLTEKTFQYKATFTPTNTTNKDVVWSSSDITIATIDNTGLVTLLKEGKVTINAKHYRNEQTNSVFQMNSNSILTIKEVYVYPTSISLSPSNITLNLQTNKNTPLPKVNVTPSNVTDKTISWVSSNKNVIDIDFGKGLVVAVGVGRTYLTAFVSGNSAVYASVLVNVFGQSATSNTRIGLVFKKK